MYYISHRFHSAIAFFHAHRYFDIQLPVCVTSIWIARCIPWNRPNGRGQHAVHVPLQQVHATIGLLALHALCLLSPAKSMQTCRARLRIYQETIQPHHRGTRPPRALKALGERESE
jgi:hypothetical protein